MLSSVANLADGYSFYRPEGAAAINNNPESQNLIASLAAPLSSDKKVKDSSRLSTYLTRNTKGAEKPA